jgi:hypothetical protein
MAIMRVLAAGALIVLLTGCAPAGPRPDPKILGTPLQRLEVPPADYFGAAWIAPRSIVLAWRPPSEEVSSPAHLVSIDPREKSHSVLPFVESDDGVLARTGGPPCAAARWSTRLH